MQQRTPVSHSTISDDTSEWFLAFEDINSEASKQITEINSHSFCECET